MKKYIFRASIIFNLVVIVIGGIIFFKQGGWVYVENGPTKVFADQPPVSPIVEIRGENLRLVGEHDKEVVFAGDSHTNYFEWGEYFDEYSVANRGVGSDTSEGLLHRTEQITALHPKKVFLLIGINDIKQGVPVETIEQNYKKIIQTLKKNDPNVQIYVQSVFPVAGDLFENNYFKRSEPINEAVAHLNRKLSQLEGVTYLDIAAKFGPELSEEYSVDGLHLNKAGYEVWLNEIEKYVKK